MTKLSEALMQPPAYVSMPTVEDCKMEIAWCEEITERLMREVGELHKTRELVETGVWDWSDDEQIVRSLLQ